MRSLIFFCFGLFFGYWFHFFRSFVRLYVAQKTLKEAEALMESAIHDMDQMMFDARALLAEDQWNEDKL